MTDDERRFDRLERDVRSQAERLGSIPPVRLTLERRELFLEEIRWSTRLAGARLSPEEVRALVERGIAAGDHPLSAYVMVAGYGEAAKIVAAAAPLGPTRRRPFLRLDELIALHQRAVAGNAAGRPGEWRSKTIAPFRSGMVAPPAWEIPRSMPPFVERFAHGPPAGRSPLLWVCDAHERFERIHPFEDANGRVGRLLANLLLARLGLPPFAVTDRTAAAYLGALRRADSGDPWPLANVVAKSVAAGLSRLGAASAGPDALVPLGALTAPAERAALYKAAQRGRLRTVRRRGRLYALPEWLAAYRERER